MGAEEPVWIVVLGREDVAAPGADPGLDLGPVAALGPTLGGGDRGRGGRPSRGLACGPLSTGHGGPPESRKRSGRTNQAGRGASSYPVSYTALRSSKASRSTRAPSPSGR